MEIFGPENTTVYQVDLFTGKIDSYKTSKAESEFDVENSDCFLKHEQAAKKSEQILSINKLSVAWGL